MTSKQPLFIDTNILIKYLENDEAKDFRGLSTDYYFVTNVFVLNELKFKILCQEAAKRLNTDKKWAILKWVKQNKEIREHIMSKYTEFYIDFIKEVKVLDVLDSEEFQTIALSAKHGLLPTDASILTHMQRYNIKHILTDDSDFKRIEGIEILDL